MTNVVSMGARVVYRTIEERVDAGLAFERRERADSVAGRLKGQKGAAQFVGMGCSSYMRARRVVLLARKDPERFGQFVSVMEKQSIGTAHAQCEAMVRGESLYMRRNASLAHSSRRELEDAVLRAEALVGLLLKINPEEVDAVVVAVEAKKLRAVRSRLTRAIKRLTKKEGDGAV